MLVKKKSASYIDFFFDDTVPLSTHNKIVITDRFTQSNFNKPARPFVNMMQLAKRTRQWTMLKTSYPPLQYSFVYCHMCAAFAIVYRRLFASQPFVVMLNTEKLIDEKTLLQTIFELFLRSNVKTEASYPRKNKMGKH